jgi:hypothetical protein
MQTSETEEADFTQAGAKARKFSGALAARLKSCPFKTSAQFEFFRNL